MGKADLKKVVKAYNIVVDRLLNHCGGDECMECGEIVCPYGEPLHLHHDGCPACDFDSEEEYWEALAKRYENHEEEGS